MYLKHAPGGQLIQATDSFVGVLNGKIVLIDDGELLRASLTASWLNKWVLMFIFLTMISIT